MSLPVGWNADTAIATCPIISWQGDAFRFHNEKYDATDPGGSLRVSGRFSRGRDKFDESAIWPALYLSTHYGVCIAEVLRHLDASTFEHLKNYAVGVIDVRLSVVLDSCDLDCLGLPDPETNLFADYDYEVGQALGAAVIKRGCEALLISSATKLPDPNLIVFPGNLHPESGITFVRRLKAVFVKRILVHPQLR